MDGTASRDGQGRYTIPTVPPGAWVRVTAFPGLGSGYLQQICATNTIMGAGAVLDVELVHRRAQGDTYASPTLSGVIYQVTPEGRRPVADTPVVFYSIYCSSPAFTR
jgi:hypothetical protein